MKKFAVLLSCLILISCSNKTLEKLQADHEFLNQAYLDAQAEHDKKMKECEDVISTNNVEVARLQGIIATLENDSENKVIQLQSLRNEMDYLKNNNSNLLTRLEDLSVISQSGAENIKQSLQAINKQSDYIQDLTQSIQKKDSTNLSLVMNLKRSLSDVNDQDVNIEVKKGVVYITLSDKLLYNSGSATITPQAESVLGKIATVLNDHSELDILVEGHTDNVPLKSGARDNWNLSTERAISIVRVLQNKYGVAPNRMTAGGRGEYYPKASNDDSYGRSINRRTEILILPKLDQFFKLLEPAN